MSETVEKDQDQDSPAPAVSTRKVRTPGRPKAEPEQDSSAPPQNAQLLMPQEHQLAPAPEADAPNCIDVDAKTLTAPMLTRQGWVCPDDSGKAPIGPR